MTHRTTNYQGIEMIKTLEGFKSQPYVCSGGYLTIGYGHKMLPSDRFNNVSEERALIILQQDLLRIERAVIKYISNELHDDQFAALVSFTYNAGAAALQRSTLRQKINYGLYHEAATEFFKWTYAGGRKIPGLLKRRKMESDLFSGPILTRVQ